jgi:hypothetical protein
METARKSPGAALLLSLVPGVGHIYAGATGAGAAWLVGTFVAYNTVGPLGFFVHFVCAVTAAQAAQRANRQEEAELLSRRENASEVARLLDDAVGAGGGPPPFVAAPPAADPPPRVMRAAFPVPPERLVQAMAEGMASSGLLVLGVDQGRLRVRASMDHGGGMHTVLAAQVEATPAGSRVRLLIDRPAGAAAGADIDDSTLRAILDRVEGVLSGQGAGPAVRSEGEALTEDHFLEQLREAWESWDQGWLPDAEWNDRRESLVRSVTLRPGTRKRDFLAACRPLAEAGVLEETHLAHIAMRLPD